MASQKNTSSATTFAKLIWSNILRAQYLNGVTDQQMSELLGVTTRTLCNYRHDPSSVTMKQLQVVVESFGVEPESLFRV